MMFDLGLINLLLYCAQQLGVALGLGAQTIMLVAYLSASRDGVIDDTEAQFLRATRSTLWVSLVLMVVSGLAISALHLLGGDAAVLFTPAYLFKSLLIALVILLTALLHELPETFAEGLLGGTWYALFVVHILAPVTTWSNLLTLFVVWMVGFTIIWYVLVFSTRERKAKEVVEPVAKPKHSWLSFFSRHKAKPVEIAQAPAIATTPTQAPVQVAPVTASVVPEMPVVPVPPVMPQQFQTIKLDPAPIAPPAAAVVTTPVAPPAAPPARPITMPVEKLPAGMTTDTPFLPQVPPLQPIPTIPPTPNANAATPMDPTQKGAPATPAAVPQITPEVKAGLNVMPKSPEQMPK